MHHPTNRIAHTTAFVTPVMEHWLEREIAQWVHPMKDRSDDPSQHEWTLLPRSYISLPGKLETKLVCITLMSFMTDLEQQMLYPQGAICSVSQSDFPHTSSVTATQFWNVKRWLLINLHRTAVIANQNFENKLFQTHVLLCDLCLSPHTPSFSQIIIHCKYSWNVLNINSFYSTLKVMMPLSGLIILLWKKLNNL